MAVCAPASLTSAQLTHTSTVTQTTSLYTTSTQLTTITNPSIIYTTTSEIVNSTISGTQTKFVPTLTTVLLNYTYALSGTVTTTSTVALTEVSTQATQILGNVWGVSLALVAFVGAIASYLILKVGARRPKGLVCGNCGTRNPPFARTHCVKCGHLLEEGSS